MPRAIDLRTEIPGPRSRELVARRDAAMPAGAARLTPIAVDRAHGGLVTDVDGNTLLDFAGGIGALALGHTPRAVVDAVQAQAARLLHMCAIVASYEPAIAAAERLNALAPGDLPRRTMLMNSGAEAVETAAHIARAFTRRQGLVVFDGAYHGRTNLTLAMTSKFALFKRGYGPFAPEVYRLPFPDLYRRPPGLSADAWLDWHLDRLDHAFTAIVDPAHVAAVFIEPVLGEGGFLPAPAPWLRRLRELCDRHGMLLVIDEIQSGMGRTGRLWACDHAGVVPDLLLTAKSLASGLPLSAVVGRADVMQAPHPGGLGGTYSGNPLACVAALASLDAIADPAFLAASARLGDRLRARLLALQARHPRVIGDVRGLGSMLAVELVKDPATREPFTEAPPAITAAALQRGLIVIRAGLYSNCVRLLPPLGLPDDQVDEAMDVLDAAVDRALADLGAA